MVQPVVPKLSVTVFGNAPGVTEISGQAKELMVPGVWRLPARSTLSNADVITSFTSSANSSLVACLEDKSTVVSISDTALSLSFFLHEKSEIEKTSTTANFKIDLLRIVVIFVKVDLCKILKFKRKAPNCFTSSKHLVLCVTYTGNLCGVWG